MLEARVDQYTCIILLPIFSFSMYTTGVFSVTMVAGCSFERALSLRGRYVVAACRHCSVLTQIHSRTLHSVHCDSVYFFCFVRDKVHGGNVCFFFIRVAFGTHLCVTVLLVFKSCGCTLPSRYNN